MSDRAEEAVEDVHERMMNFVDEPETVIEDEEHTEQEASNETLEDSEENDHESDQEVDDDDPILEIQWGDEKKLVSKAEAKDLAEKGYNYTQNMQSLAEQRRAVEAQAQSLQLQATIQTELGGLGHEIQSLDKSIAQYKQINWGELAEQDPAQYLKLNQAYRDLKEERDTKAGEYVQKAQYIEQYQIQVKDQLLQSESKLLANKIPDFASSKSAETKENLKAYLSKEGFSQAEVGSILDHRMIAVAWKAAQYDKLQNAKPGVNKKVADAPKSIKSNQRTDIKSSEKADLRSRLKKTGRSDIAAKLIEGML